MKLPTAVFAAAASGMLATACNNDVPDNPVTIGGGDSDGGGDGNDDDPDPPACSPEVEVTDPALFQCSGQGIGSFRRLECKELTCTSNASQDVAEACAEIMGNADDKIEEWTIGNKQITVAFPPSSGDTGGDTGGLDDTGGDESSTGLGCGTPGDCNAQACCESDASNNQLDQGCISDCARAACNRALLELEDSLANVGVDPPAGCTQVCQDRTKKTLETWIAFLETNFDDCLTLASNNVANDVMFFPNPDEEAWAGTAVCGQLKLDCQLDAAATEIASTCEESYNELLPAPAERRLSCPLSADIEYDGPEGNTFNTASGTAIVRRGTCTSDPCWFQIESLELEMDDFSDNNYTADDVNAALAYPGFGMYDDSTDDGSIAPLMLGLDVDTFIGDTPSTTPTRYWFAMSNTDSAVFSVQYSRFQIVDAYFAWADRSLTVTSDLAACTCLNC